jgi:hypothetical protein
VGVGLSRVGYSGVGVQWGWGSVGYGANVCLAPMRVRSSSFSYPVSIQSILVNTRVGGTVITVLSYPQYQDYQDFSLTLVRKTKIFREYGHFDFFIH